MKLIIEKDEQGRLQVWRDGYTTGFLTLGELLETVVGHLDVRPPLFEMRTPEKWDAPYGERGPAANFKTIPATKETAQ